MPAVSAVSIGGLDVVRDQALVVLLRRDTDAVVRCVEVQRAELVEARSGSTAEVDLLDDVSETELERCFSAEVTMQP